MTIIGMLQSAGGRIARIAIGVVLIVVGLAIGHWWALLALLGVVPLAAGALNICLLSPFFGRPFRRTAN
jgi:hypothetical protein